MTTQDTKTLYNQLCFLLNILIPKIDELEGTNVYRQDVKFHANRLREKIIPMADEHQLAYINYGTVPNDDKMIHTRDVFNITDQAYEDALDWFFNRPPSHVVATMSAIKKMEEKNPNLMQEIGTWYTPVDSDLTENK